MKLNLRKKKIIKKKIIKKGGTKEIIDIKEIEENK